MAETLYTQARNIEIVNEQIRGLNPSNELDVAQLQRELFQKYEKNPVLRDAIDRRISLEGSLLRLAEVNAPVRKLFPRKIDQAHNDRLDELGKLITEPYQLKTNGILNPDNFLGGVAWTTVTLETLSLFAPCLKYMFSPSEDPIELSKIVEGYRGAIMTLPLICGPVIGMFMHSIKCGKLPIDEAKYLDKKVQEFYK